MFISIYISKQHLAAYQWFMMLMCSELRALNLSKWKVWLFLNRKDINITAKNIAFYSFKVNMIFFSLYFMNCIHLHLFLNIMQTDIDYTSLRTAPSRQKCLLTTPAWSVCYYFRAFTTSLSVCLIFY